HDERAELRIVALDAHDRGVDQLARRRLTRAHELGLRGGIEVGEVHGRGEPNRSYGDGDGDGDGDLPETRSNAVRTCVITAYERVSADGYGSIRSNDVRTSAMTVYERVSSATRSLSEHAGADGDGDGAVGGAAAPHVASRYAIERTRPAIASAAATASASR